MSTLPPSIYDVRSKRRTDRCGWTEGDVGYIPLSNGEVTIMDAGDLPYLEQWSWAKLDKYAGRGVRIDGARYAVLLHRQLLDLRDPDVHGDHINGNHLDNRRSNLRVATRVQNAANSRPKRNTSPYKGIYQLPSGRWRAFIGPSGKGDKRHLGVFDTPEEAALAYNTAAIARYGEYASLNHVTTEGAEYGA